MAQVHGAAAPLGRLRRTPPSQAHRPGLVHTPALTLEGWAAAAGPAHAQHRESNAMNPGQQPHERHGSLLQGALVVGGGSRGGGDHERGGKIPVLGGLNSSLGGGHWGGSCSNKRSRRRGSLLWLMGRLGTHDRLSARCDCGDRATPCWGSCRNALIVDRDHKNVTPLNGGGIFDGTALEHAPGVMVAVVLACWSESCQRQPRRSAEAHAHQARRRQRFRAQNPGDVFCCLCLKSQACLGLQLRQDCQENRKKQICGLSRLQAFFAPESLNHFQQRMRG